ncbi:MAG: hypothetical protein JHD16_10415 [Solirubrobacteraceae bacterium]|nr:hypothetical protein [Solirubrobacteraceae bacterium]
MRTTITLDPDVAARLAELQDARGLSFKDAVNETLRRGLGASDGATPYRMPVRALGVRAGVDVDRIRDELGRLDDERLEFPDPQVGAP